MKTKNDLLFTDFKPVQQRSRSWGKTHVRVLALMLALGGTTALLWPGPEAEANRSETPSASVSAQGGTITESLALPQLGGGEDSSQKLAYIPPAPALPNAAPEAEPALPEAEAVPEPEAPTEAVSASDGTVTEDDATEWQKITIKPGDTLAAVFARLDLSPRLLHNLVNSGAEGKSLTRIHPGEVLAFDIRNGELHRLRHNRSTTEALIFTHTDQGFEVEHEQRDVEIRIAHAAGVIDSSLYVSGKAAGLSDRLIMELVGIFGWDIDFALDLREGDSFLVMYETRYLDGEPLGEGAIVAAEFVNRNRPFQAVRFASADGHTDYYNPDGRSLRKAFLRSPVDFRRISSRFTSERYHPVLGKRRPHRGVDYAAKTGTPIKASGDGKIVHRGWKGGYGRTVVIQHGGRISTLYAHLSRYRGGLRVGSRVKQGQVIGYVGASGLATGPHLHYEFLVNGTHRNPLTVKLPKAAPIPDKYRETFDAEAGKLLSQLEALKRTQVALGQ